MISGCSKVRLGITSQGSCITCSPHHVCGQQLLRVGGVHPSTDATEPYVPTNGVILDLQVQLHNGRSMNI